MYDLKHKKKVPTPRYFNKVSVAEPAMYDLKLRLQVFLSVFCQFQLLNQQCMI